MDRKKKLKEKTFTWIRDIYIDEFNGADQKRERPVFCFISSKNYVLGYKTYSNKSKMVPNRIELPFEITKNKVSYIDLNKVFVLNKRIRHQRVKKAKKEDIEYIHQQILGLDYAKEKFIKGIEQMEKYEKARKQENSILM